MPEDMKGCGILLFGGTLLLFLLTGLDGVGHLFVIIVVCFILYYLYAGKVR